MLSLIHSVVTLACGTGPGWGGAETYVALSKLMGGWMDGWVDG